LETDIIGLFEYKKSILSIVIEGFIMDSLVNDSLRISSRLVFNLFMKCASVFSKISIFDSSSIKKREILKKNIKKYQKIDKKIPISQKPILQ
jgi:hypothetical protein